MRHINTDQLISPLSDGVPSSFDTPEFRYLNMESKSQDIFSVDDFSADYIDEDAAVMALIEDKRFDRAKEFIAAVNKRNKKKRRKDKDYNEQALNLNQVFYLMMRIPDKYFDDETIKFMLSLPGVSPLAIFGSGSAFEEIVRQGNIALLEKMYKRSTFSAILFERALFDLVRDGEIATATELLLWVASKDEYINYNEILFELAKRVNDQCSKALVELMLSQHNVNPYITFANSSAFIEIARLGDVDLLQKVFDKTFSCTHWHNDAVKQVDILRRKDGLFRVSKKVRTKLFFLRMKFQKSSHCDGVKDVAASRQAKPSLLSRSIQQHERAAPIKAEIQSLEAQIAEISNKIDECKTRVSETRNESNPNVNLKEQLSTNYKQFKQLLSEQKSLEAPYSFLERCRLKYRNRVVTNVLNLLRVASVTDLESRTKKKAENTRESNECFKRLVKIEKQFELPANVKSIDYYHGDYAIKQCEDKLSKDAEQFERERGEKMLAFSLQITTAQKKCALLNKNLEAKKAELSLVLDLSSDVVVKETTDHVKPEVVAQPCDFPSRHVDKNQIVINVAKQLLFNNLFAQQPEPYVTERIVKTPTESNFACACG